MEMLTTAVSELEKELNPDWWSWDVFRGIFMFLLCLGLGFCIVKKLTKFVWCGLMLILLVQICHVFAMSDLGANFSWLQTMFKYDVLQSIAQLFVGTPIATGILYIQAFLNQTFSMVFDAIVLIWELVKPCIYKVRDAFAQFR